MSLISLLMSLLILLQYTHFPSPADAAQVNFTPAGSGAAGTFEGEVPVNKIGKLLLPDGIAVIKGNVIDVVGTAKGSTDKKTQLSGVVVKTEATVSGTKCKMTGTAYFRQGPALAMLGGDDEEELIDLVDGGVVSGKIVAINRDECEVEDNQQRRRRFAMAMIRGIRSPFAFTLALSGVAAAAVSVGTAFTCEVPKVSFNPTAVAGKPTVAQKPEKTQQTSTSGSPNVGKIVAITAVCLGVAAAIAIPLAVAIPLANRGGGGPKPEDILIYNQFFNRPPPPPPPSPPPSGP